MRTFEIEIPSNKQGTPIRNNITIFRGRSGNSELVLTVQNTSLEDTSHTRHKSKSIATPNHSLLREQYMLEILASLKKSESVHS